MLFRDHIGREFQLEHTPQRIISLVPSQTELLCDLGLESSLVGITRFCVHPTYLRKEKQRVGGTKRVSLKKVKELQPDIILCNKEENTPEMVAELEQIAPVHVSDISGIPETLQLIRDYGKIFNVVSEAQNLIRKLSRELQEFENFVADRPYKQVLYFIWKEPYMVAGNDTFINKMLQLNHLENVVGQNRYPELSLAEIEQMNPELILLSSEPYPFTEKDMEEFERFSGKVVVVDGEAFSWYGSRLLKSLDYFKELKL